MLTLHYSFKVTPTHFSKLKTYWLGNREDMLVYKRVGISNTWNEEFKASVPVFGEQIIFILLGPHYNASLKFSKT